MISQRYGVFSLMKEKWWGIFVPLPLVECGCAIPHIPTDHITCQHRQIRLQGPKQEVDEWHRKEIFKFRFSTVKISYLENRKIACFIEGELLRWETYNSRGTEKQSEEELPNDSLFFHLKSLVYDIWSKPISLFFTLIFSDVFIIFKSTSSLSWSFQKLLPFKKSWEHFSFNLWN